MSNIGKHVTATAKRTSEHFGPTLSGVVLDEITVDNTSDIRLDLDSGGEITIWYEAYDWQVTPAPFDLATHHVHVGVKPRNLLALNRAFPAAKFGVEADGDGWNCWGEPVGTDINDDETLHVVIYRGTLAGSPLEVAQQIIADLGSILEPMSGPAYQASVILSISDGEDWGEKYANAHSDGRIFHREDLTAESVLTKVTTR